MLATLTGVLNGVAHFYAWTVGIGLVVLALIMLAQGAADLIRDRIHPPSRRRLPGPPV
jgi:hypothetical protein